MREALKGNYEAFAREAEAFCHQLETMDATQRESLCRVRESLAALYAMAIVLPAVERAKFKALKTEEMSARARELFRRWRREFQVDEFRIVLNPLSQQDAVTGSVADCLADIWLDLKPGLEALAHDDRSDRFLRRDVWWKWKFGFDYHWGKHALEVLYTLHFLVLEDSGGAEPLC